MNIFKEISNLVESGDEFAVVTIIGAKGSVPRKSARMVVFRDGRQIGTIGGGPAEMKATCDAVECLINAKGGVFNYILNQDIPDALPMHCGGNMDLHIEVFSSKPRILLGGAGHVNHAVAKLASDIGFEIVVVDDRREFATKEKFPLADVHIYDPGIKDAMSTAVDRGLVDENTYVVIATKDCDEQALRGIIDVKTAYIGVIGSKRKIMKIRDNLLNDNYGKDILNGIFWPVGLNVGGESPAEIAISIMAEILKVKNKGSGESMRLPFL